MDTKLLKKLLRKAHLITYVFKGVPDNLRSATYLNDTEDRLSEIRFIIHDGTTRNPYKLSAGVYLYRQVRKQFKLIAIISDSGIKEL